MLKEAIDRGSREAQRFHDAIGRKTVVVQVRVHVAARLIERHGPRERRLAALQPRLLAERVRDQQHDLAQQRARQKNCDVPAGRAFELHGLVEIDGEDTAFEHRVRAPFAGIHELAVGRGVEKYVEGCCASCPGRSARSSDLA
uniref:hypothetical protein n=1 Tax=Trinickia mobilis TaxID=2816356 RepID=UPI001F5DD12C|nr:hypothetical protein [Trinickia mobilis]